MNGKFLLVGTVAAGITLFAWDSISHVLLPWHEATMEEFKDEQAVLETIQENAPKNGVYFSGHGIFAVVSLLPDLSDQTESIGANLTVQAVTDLLLAFLLCALLLWAKSSSILGRAGFVTLIGLAGGVAIHIPHWNWYGFSSVYSLINLLDLGIGCFLAGLVLAGIMSKIYPRA